MKLCQCGCGMEVKEKRSYVHNHHRKGFTVSEETRAKLSILNKGENNPMFNKNHSEDVKRKIAFAGIGRIPSEKTRKNISLSKIGEKNPMFGKRGEESPSFGRHHSEETRSRLSIINKGRIVSEEVKAKLSFTNKGVKNGFFGKFHSKEAKEKNRNAHLKENSYFWYGGIHGKPYAPGNTKELKEQIQERDNYTCQECNKVWIKGKRKFAPHHIDYDKKNHAMWNRIILCPSCHGRTAVNREFWTKYLYEKNFDNCIKRILGG